MSEHKHDKYRCAFFLAMLMLFVAMSSVQTNTGDRLPFVEAFINVVLIWFGTGLSSAIPSSGYFIA